MAQSLSCLLTHVVFSTKGRTPWIVPEVRPELHAYLAGLAREAGCHCHRVGGVAVGHQRGHGAEHLDVVDQAAGVAAVGAADRRGGHLRQGADKVRRRVGRGLGVGLMNARMVVNGMVSGLQPSAVGDGRFLGLAA